MRFLVRYDENRQPAIASFQGVVGSQPIARPLLALPIQFSLDFGDGADQFCNQTVSDCGDEQFVRCLENRVIR
jgi:hypothetical protein